MVKVPLDPILDTFLGKLNQLGLLFDLQCQHTQNLGVTLGLAVSPDDKIENFVIGWSKASPKSVEFRSDRFVRLSSHDFDGGIVSIPTYNMRFGRAKCGKNLDRISIFPVHNPTSFGSDQIVEVPSAGEPEIHFKRVAIGIERFGSFQKFHDRILSRGVA